MEISILIIDTIVEAETEMRRCGTLKDLRLLMHAQFDESHLRQLNFLKTHNLVQMRVILGNYVTIIGEQQN